MLKVIPAIDLLDGSVVRLQKGDYDKQTTYKQDPVEQAQIYKDAGFSHIHVVDLNGAKEGEFKNLGIITEIVQSVGLSVQTGGGIRSFDDCKRLFDAGISNIVCSSMVVKNEKDWLKALDAYPGDQCIMGLDLKDGKLAYGGWLETSDDPIEDFLTTYIDRGLTTVLSTDISRDGMLKGVNLPMYKGLQKSFPDLKIIASGGVASLKDLQELDDLGTYAVVVGRAYYEGHLTLNEMKIYA